MTGTWDPIGSDERDRFDELQRRLPEQFRRFRGDPTQTYTAVVVPSQSFDPEELAKIQGVAHYEERSLFNLMLLRRPRMKVVFVTSKRIDPLIVDYYLHQMRGVPSEHARRRLLLLDCDDAAPIPLSQKILDRPRLISRIQEAIEDPNMAHLVFFNGSPLERTLALRLGIPMNATGPDLMYLGTKTGSREVFREANVGSAAGREGIESFETLIDALNDLWEEIPTARRLVIKLNDSFSGEGNAVLELGQIANSAPGRASRAARRGALEGALENLTFESGDLSWPRYLGQLEQMGGICEEWIEGPNKRSPSVQLRINPLGEVMPVSTHDQVLGGPNGQVFLGATFPAHSDYRLQIQSCGVQVGEVLAKHGAIGRFSVDFIVRPTSAGWDVRALEINLRQGGTTHPFNTMKSLTDGCYDTEDGVFYTAQGQPRAYFATDNLQSDRYRGLLPFDLIDLLVLENLHFRSNETGVVFHLLGCLSQFGKLGCTAIASTVAEAESLYKDTVTALDRASTGT